ncbi:hypothetical protein HHL21_12055 [Massilia sp. RP-1-19]|uniref:Uncharacterized protein n=1 Tax=Massilia polaris TaxID=2728846 RepID=A0A848HNR3_9BURK|nr:hypothetical protein [Massilia polaris]NML61800.1 hypothetical protein [Massilia polaris]
MTKSHNAAGTPAAVTPYVSASQIGLLIEVAVLAIQDSQQQAKIKIARWTYLDALNDFEAQHGRIEGRLDPRNPDHADILAATEKQYAASEREKRIAYNLRRRLQTACRKAARVNATGVCATDRSPS